MNLNIREQVARWWNTCVEQSDPYLSPEDLFKDIFMGIKGRAAEKVTAPLRTHTWRDAKEERVFCLPFLSLSWHYTGLSFPFLKRVK